MQLYLNALSQPLAARLLVGAQEGQVQVVAELVEVLN